MSNWVNKAQWRDCGDVNNRHIVKKSHPTDYINNPHYRGVINSSMGNSEKKNPSLFTPRLSADDH